MMNLGENIRRIRMERGLTQAALAEALGVSDRAVSRWERSVSMPDVALLAQLALVLETSTDALLAVDPLQMQADILHVTEKCTTLLNQNRPTEAVQFLREASTRYPHQPELMVYLARSLLALKTEAAQQEALSLCRAANRRISSGNGDVRLSTAFGCKQVMALCLHHLGRMEEAARLVTDEMPAIWVSRELLLAKVAPPEQAQRIRESNAALLSGLLIRTLEQLDRKDTAQVIREICPP